MKLTIWVAFLITAIWYVTRKPLEEREMRRKVGLQAAVDATLMNGYTTYNTQIYIPPLFRPLMKFWKAGAFVPQTDGSMRAQPVEYSMPLQG